MFAIRMRRPEPADPLRCLDIGHGPPGKAPDDWVTVQLRAASVNSADFASMSGYGVIPERLPTVLGSDGAGTDEDGNEVIVYPVLADPARGGGDPMLDPGLRMLSQGIDGTFAEQVRVPRANLVPKPPGLSWDAAACLGTAWLTAYRMLFGRAAVRPGETVLVQGAGGGVASALTVLARAAGVRVWVASRDPARGERAVAELGAERAFLTGAKLPEPVDAVMDPVGGPVFPHSVAALRPGGRVVIAGAVGGAVVRLDLTELFVRSVSVIGSALGSPEELDRLARLCAGQALTVPIDSVWPLKQGREAFERMRQGQPFGKIVLLCA